MVCDGNVKRLCKDEDCAECWDRSFASSDKAQYWSAKNTVSPRDVFLQSNKKYNIVRQTKYDWCRNPETNKYRPFDFVLEDYKIIIELDGRQHFRQVSNWGMPEEQQKADKYKMEKALENGYSIIRLPQEDVFDDKNNWLKKLISAIKKYDIPQKIFITAGQEYKDY